MKFEYETPMIVARNICKEMGQIQKNDIHKRPYVSINSCPYCLTLDINGEEVQFRGTIPAGYCYNQADIPFLLQPIGYDKHSPFVKNASYFHDFLLQYGKQIYTNWKLKDYGISVDEFRCITSEIFKIVLIDSGVPEKKANLMAKSVNIFQKLFGRKNWRF